MYILTCWSHSGQDLVAILTFFVLFADIVRLLQRRADSSAVATALACSTWRAADLLRRTHTDVAG